MTSARINGLYGLALAGCLASGSRAAEIISTPSDPNSVAIQSEAEQRQFVETLDIKFRALKQAVPAVTTLGTLQHERDFRRRQFRDDWRDYVLQPAAVARIADARQRVTEQLAFKHLETSMMLLGVLENRLQKEAQLGSAIVEYWRKIGAHPPDWKPFEAMLNANHIEVEHAAKIESLERTFNLQIRRGLFWKAMMWTTPMLDALRNQEVHQATAALEKRSQSESLARLYAVTASAPCEPPVSKTSGSSAVKLDPDRSAPTIAYPEAARRQSEQGAVNVGVTVGRDGCARMASVYGSSGYELLDRAAVEHALLMRFLPPERDGQAVEAHVMLPVHFNLAKP
jgi:TonB family protein